MSYQQLPGAWDWLHEPASQHTQYQQDAPPQQQYGVVPGTVVPEYGSYQPRPSAYRGWITAAGLAGVLFSLIIGMPMALLALHYSRRVQRRWSAGDQPGASRASRSARAWVIAATVFDILGLILVIALLAHAGHSTS